MLMGGKYPAQLKQRISSNLGHLSNAQAASFLGEVLHDKLDHVVVGHISEQNNDPQRCMRLLVVLNPQLLTFNTLLKPKGMDGWRYPHRWGQQCNRLDRRGAGAVERA
ncbi:MAG: hypothetical protein CM1200mP24_06130 [Gammaproteobacteria bacterium]|nr:MAG: hypothetical protein CM1200mP24_06130 [Gammaproteobacteria bacterium]